LEEDTKFHQMWRGPSKGSPPRSIRRAGTSQGTDLHLGPGPKDRELIGLEPLAVHPNCPMGHVHAALDHVEGHNQVGVGIEFHVCVEHGPVGFDG